MIVTSMADWAGAGLPPALRILAHGEAAWDVPYPAHTPTMPRRQALPRAEIQRDVDVWEINEAFASVPIISSQGSILTPVASM